jgi:putative oxidoreductase
MAGTRDFGALVGRVLLALIFVLSGFGKLTSPAMSAGYMAHAGIPAGLIYPGLYLSVAVEFGCGLLLVLGYKVRWAAMLIFLWFIPVTLVFHVAAYHQAVLDKQPMVAITQQIMFLKNISIMGGLLVVASFGAGAISLDGRGATEPRAGNLRAA